MKHIGYWLSITLASILFISFVNCSKTEEDEQGSGEIISGLTVSKSDIIINGSSSGTFEIKAKTGWRIDVPENASSWLTITPLEGSGDATITCETQIPQYRETFKATLEVVNKLANTSTPVNVTCKPQNTAPTAPTNPYYPTDGATDVTEPFFRLSWEPSTDAENDKINYDVYYSIDNTNWTLLASELEVNQYSSTSTLKKETKYYWKVKAYDLYGAASPESKVFTFKTASTFGGWEDGEVRLYQPCVNSSASDPFTLIITGDGFTADAFVPGGDWDQISQRAIDALLTNMEPYKTWGNYLRIIRIGAYSEESGISEHKSSTSPLKVVKTKFNTTYDNISNSAWAGYEDTSNGSLIFDWCLEQASKAGFDVKKNYSVVVLQNVAHYNGTVLQYMGSLRTLGFVCMSPGKKGSTTGFENVFCHEIGGHAIGHFADLYTSVSGTLPSSKISETQQMQSKGWYMNVSLVNSEEECPWSIFFTSKEKELYYPQVGLFEGARSYTQGIWRAEESKTLMNDNRFVMDAPSRYFIVKQLLQAAGETLTWERFVNKDYDRSNSDFSTTRSADYSDSTVPLLHSPIIIND